MPRDAVSRTANVERNGGHKWVKEARTCRTTQSLKFHSVWDDSCTLKHILCTKHQNSPNPTTGGSRLIFCLPFSCFLFIFYLLRCTLPDFPSISSQASFPFLSRRHRTTTTLKLVLAIVNWHTFQDVYKQLDLFHTEWLVIVVCCSFGCQPHHR